jgi:hypothetical protein
VIAGLENALGGRVRKVHETPISRATELIVPLAARDENPPLAQAFVEDALPTGATLHGLGITPDRNAARYLLADDTGREFNVEVQAVAPGAKATLLRPFQQPPLYRENPKSRFWCKSLPDANAVLQCSRHAKSIHSVKGTARPRYAAQSGQARDDLRQNGGGDDYTVGERWLVHPIRYMAAVLVGQTIGGKPNSHAEVRNMMLPNSHFTVRYSTRYYKFSEGLENAIRPDREIIPSWDDYKAGRDPVLEGVLRSDPKHL